MTVVTSAGRASVTFVPGLLVLTLSLGACQSFTPLAGRSTVKTAPGPVTPHVRTVTPAPMIARARPQPARTYPDPDTLTGRSSDDVIQSIGKPDFVRKDRPAEIWQYRGSLCTLDIFLFQNGAGAPYQVDYIETRAKLKGPTSNSACLTSILKERDPQNTTRSAS